MLLIRKAYPRFGYTFFCKQQTALSAVLHQLHNTSAIGLLAKH